MCEATGGTWENDQCTAFDPEDKDPIPSFQCADGDYLEDGQCWTPHQYAFLDLNGNGTFPDDVAECAIYGDNYKQGYYSVWIQSFAENAGGSTDKCVFDMNNNGKYEQTDPTRDIGTGDASPTLGALQPPAE